MYDCVFVCADIMAQFSSNLNPYCIAKVSVRLSNVLTAGLWEIHGCNDVIINHLSCPPAIIHRTITETGNYSHEIVHHYFNFIALYSTRNL